MACVSLCCGCQIHPPYRDVIRWVLGCRYDLADMYLSRRICPSNHQRSLVPRVPLKSPISLSKKLAISLKHQCALRPDGSLKDASEIKWVNDPDDNIPVAPGRSPSRRPRNTARMAEIIAAEQDSGDDNNSKPSRKRKRTRKGKSKAAQTDEEDDDFVRSSSESETEGSNCDEITNEELADSLPSKTIPSGSGRHITAPVKSRAKKRCQLAKKHRHTTTAVCTKATELMQPSEGNSGPPKAKAKAGKRNPIYHFYKEVELNKDGKSGEPGDKHYQCYHGNRKVLTISKAMNYSLNGLVGHLRSTFKPLFQLYLVMKSRNGHPPTPDEIMYASGQKPFDSTTHMLYLQELEKHTTSIKEAFLKQRAAENVRLRVTVLTGTWRY
ncbi:hypothetical protein EDB86DRAFT_3116932 [Lactarius hatsudake]|nr:hypothetical protein EDB86DRAFT_3116932 [Lactarius hatsudake]